MKVLFAFEELFPFFSWTSLFSNFLCFPADIDDVEKLCPGLLKATVEWFKIYKIPDGKPENKFAFNGEAKNAEFANKIVAEVNKHWLSVMKKEIDAGGMSL